MAREDFGQALIPLGVAKSLGFTSSEISTLSPKINRHVHLIARKTVMELEVIQKFGKVLSEMMVGSL